MPSLETLFLRLIIFFAKPINGHMTYFETYKKAYEDSSNFSSLYYETTIFLLKTEKLRKEEFTKCGF